MAVAAPTAPSKDELDAMDQRAIEATHIFTDWYYKQLNTDVPKIAQAYVSNNRLYKEAGHPGSDITIGGARISKPEDYEWLLTMQRRTAAGNDKVIYDVESVDVHVANPDYRVAAPDLVLGDLGGSTKGRRLMLVVSVDGVVTFGSARDSEKQAFHENFILVPNWEVLLKREARNAKKYLVESQNFRRRG